MAEAGGRVPPVGVALAAPLEDILYASLVALAAAGELEEACRLAGRACAACRLTDARAWNRFNGLLHRFTARS